MMVQKDMSLQIQIVLQDHMHEAIIETLIEGVRMSPHSKETQHSSPT